MQVTMSVYLSAAMAVIRQANVMAFTPSLHQGPLSKSLSRRSLLSRYMTSSSSSLTQDVKSGVSRLSVLQTLLSKAGAPGAEVCTKPNDLQPVVDPFTSNDQKILGLHPHLFPIAQSKSNPSYYICALRRAYADDAMYESSSNAPWPIVESKVQGPGYKLLSLNSEHFMRRIAATADKDDDTTESDQELIDTYNADLGTGQIDANFDQKYVSGSVSQLGYGTSKYILLRVGPFPDLYQEMASNHQARNDESSSLIAAEAANGKFVGFGSSFFQYAQLLSTFDLRDEEARDAARMCLRLPLPSVALEEDDYVKLGYLAGVSDKNAELDVALESIKSMYDKIKEHEAEDEQGKANMTPEQMAIEEANQILDQVVFDGGNRDWNRVRKQLGEIYASAGLDDMASFVDPSRFESAGDFM